jgi:hypothetical protein
MIRQTPRDKYHKQIPPKHTSIMGEHMITPREYCQKLRDEITNGESIENDNLQIRILDFFIGVRLMPDKFEQLLRARIDDSDLAKEESRAICAEILEGWENQKRMEEGFSQYPDTATDYHQTSL